MRLRHAFAITAAAVLSLAATKPAPRVWHANVTVSPSGSHVLGKPDAAVKLVEYVSYTCSHCAEFEVEASDAMRLAWVSPGRLSIEVRHLMRDPIDATVTQLANCGAPAKFFGNHAAFLRSQATWISRQQKLTRAQQERWKVGDNPTRRRTIATDLNLYDIMLRRGYDRPTVNRCLADEKLAERLAAQTKAASEAGVRATPSFALNGGLLAGTHTWDMLEPQIRARM
jgi:protein-disulfide isomerase